MVRKQKLLMHKRCGKLLVNGAFLSLYTPQMTACLYTHSNTKQWKNQINIESMSLSMYPIQNELQNTQTAETACPTCTNPWA